MHHAIESHLNLLAQQADNETNVAKRERLNSKIFVLMFKHGVD